jgi:hypothetical protein
MQSDRKYYERKGEHAARSGGIQCSEPEVTHGVIRMLGEFGGSAQLIADVGCGANLEYDAYIADSTNRRVVAIDFSFNFLRLAPRNCSISLCFPCRVRRGASNYSTS